MLVVFPLPSSDELLLFEDVFLVLKVSESKMTEVDSFLRKAVRQRQKAKKQRKEALARNEMK